MEKAGCGNCGQVFGGNVQSNRGRGVGRKRGGGSVQILRAAVGPVIRQLPDSPTQHQEGTTGLGAALEVDTEGGGGAGILVRVLPRGSSGGAIVWSIYMGDFGANGAEVRGSACGLLRQVTGKKAKRMRNRVVAADEGNNSPPESGDTAALDICEQET